MFDKEYTLTLVNRVIKEEIIPSLTDDVAKEQAIAMVSVLKNVNLNTTQNQKIYKEVNQLLFRQLTNILNKMEKDEIIHQCGYLKRVKKLQNQLQKLQSEVDPKFKWEEHNKLFSELIKCMYQQADRLDHYIRALRQIMRNQLTIEIQYVS